MARSFKRPESVLVVVHTVAAEVLLLRRRRPADFLQSVTGSLKWYETQPIQAARRELWEETALGDDVEIVDCGVVNRFPILPEWRNRYAPLDRENVEYVFRVELPARWPIRLNPQEHSEYLWLSRQEAAAKATSWTNREAIQRFVPMSFQNE